MIQIINKQRKIKVPVKKLEQSIQAMLKVLKYEDFDVGLFLTTDRTIRQYNKTYRNKDKATDILSFPYHTEIKPGQKIIVKTPEDKNLGDIIISLEYVKRSAPDWSRSFENHLIALLAHGMAHLLNHTHDLDTDFELMQKIEKKLLSACN